MRGATDRAKLARSTLAHELRTPLSVIVGYAELLRTREDPFRIEASERILEAADRLSSVIDDLVGQLGDSGSHPSTLSWESVKTPGRRMRRIMLVDDDDAVRNLLRLTFPVDEFEILEAADGREALELTAEQPVDLVVLDWQLPGRSGAEVLSVLKQRESPPSVLVLTADGGALVESGAAEAFLTKPFSPVQLLEVIERLLGTDE